MSTGESRGHRNSDELPKNFKSRKTGPNTKRDRYGPLDWIAHNVPHILYYLEKWIVHFMHFFVHVALVVGIILELMGAGAAAGRADVWAKDGPVGAVRCLLSIFYDCFLGIAQVVHCFLWLLGLNLVHDHKITTLSRLAVLQSIGATILWTSSVARWKRRPGEYRAPPLFTLLAYFASPWTGFSMWMFTLTHGHHKLGGSIAHDMAYLSTIFTVRWFLFGHYGLPRAPRAPRSVLEWFQDAAVLMFLLAVIDYYIFRNAFLEVIENWKYMICAANLTWAWFLFPAILGYFRWEASKARDEAEEAPQKKRKSVAQQVDETVDALMKAAAKLTARQNGEESEPSQEGEQVDGLGEGEDSRAD